MVTKVPDNRLGERFERLQTQLSENPEERMPLARRVARTKPKRPTVFWGNARVTHEALIGDLQAETLARIGNAERVLPIPGLSA